MVHFPAHVPARQWGAVVGQSVSIAHCAQTPPWMQNGVGAAQSVSIKHCTHWPSGSQSFAAAGQSELDAHCTHSCVLVLQNGVGARH